MHRRLGILASILALVCLVASPVAADPKFSNKDVEGPTAFDFDGFVTVAAGPPPVVLPVASVGRFVADGKGKLNDGFRTLIIAGAVSTQSFTCNYTVDRDGTGSASCTVTQITPTPGTAAGDTSHETFDFVIAESKKEAFFTATDGVGTIRGRTKRQQ